MSLDELRGDEREGGAPRSGASNGRYSDSGGCRWSRSDDMIHVGIEESLQNGSSAAMRRLAVL